MPRVPRVLDLAVECAAKMLRRQYYPLLSLQVFARGFDPDLPVAERTFYEFVERPGEDAEEDDSEDSPEDFSSEFARDLFKQVDMATKEDAGSFFPQSDREQPSAKLRRDSNG